jgi:hypothetical protein
LKLTNGGILMDLTQVEPQKISKDLSSYTSFLFGPPKAGKTTFYHQLFGKKAIFARTEKGSKAVAGLMGQDISNWSDFMKFKKQLSRKEVKEIFDVVVIDTFDNLCIYLEKYVKNKYGADNLKDANGGWGAGHKEFSETLFMALNDIESYGYTIHFISHSKKEKEKLPGTEEEYEKYVPSAVKRGMEIATKMVDNILFAYLAVNPETKQEQRVLYTRETLYFQAGTRFTHLQAALPMSAEAYRNAVTAAILAEGEENLKEEKEVNIVIGEELNFEALMQEAKEIAVEMNKAGRLAEVNEIVEKYLGQGKLMRDATETQVETVKIIVEELRLL